MNPASQSQVGPTPGAFSGASQAVPGGGQILVHILRLRQCCGHMHLLKNVITYKYCSQLIKLREERRQSSLSSTHMIH